MVIQGGTRWARDIIHAIAPTSVRYHSLSAYGTKIALLGRADEVIE
jgi:hypothetical protein